MNKIFTYMLLLCLTSCASIPGFYSGYKKLPAEEKQKVKHIVNMLPDSLYNDGNVYMVNAGQLSNYMEKKGKVLIYGWAPFCSSEICIPLSTVQEFCRERGLTLLVIMEYYDFNSIPDSNDFYSPVFSIDTRYYHTDLCNRYTQKFYKELTGKSQKELNYARYYYFVNGKFEGTYDKYIKDYLSNN